MPHLVLVVTISVDPEPEGTWIWRLEPDNSWTHVLPVSSETETHVDVKVTRHAGMPDEETRRFQVILREDDQAVEVCRVRV